ncbi:Glutathione S-transferase/chloride channel, C-terminal [Artemisia annua]|uniref:glutathione transferase n=1 Tax=Artemisia annua TaxID=35608 RepID=A0A2U1Q3M4_ARTAN|nr:Glutathione S-transferase/chloride channel, C-terminal [Artemisia annua]
MALKVYVDRMSPPSRAVLLFCKVNGIEFEEILLDILKNKHTTPEYKEINPMCQLPAIVDGEFKLFESHAILIYLSCAFPGVASHWYPSDLFKRSKLHSVLDWHHTNLRLGSGGLLLNSIVGQIKGNPPNVEAAKEGEKLLVKSLTKLENFWLKDGQFLVGSSQPSIADISLVCEIMQLECLGKLSLRSLSAICEGKNKLKLQNWSLLECISPEAHAILIYICCAFPGVASHWYPGDVSKRAKIHSVLDWHHTNLRPGSAGFVFNTILGPLRGIPSSPETIKENEKMLLRSLSKLENFWLKDGRFLVGSSQPSIADISLVCEIMQLELLTEKDHDRILSPYKKVLQWVEDTKSATAPHFDEVHRLLFRAQKKFHEQMAAQSGKSELKSKL